MPSYMKRKKEDEEKNIRHMKETHKKKGREERGENGTYKRGKVEYKGRCDYVRNGDKQG